MVKSNLVRMIEAGWGYMQGEEVEPGGGNESTEALHLGIKFMLGWTQRGTYLDWGPRDHRVQVRGREQQTRGKRRRSERRRGWTGEWRTCVAQGCESQDWRSKSQRSSAEPEDGEEEGQV